MSRRVKVLRRLSIAVVLSAVCLTGASGTPASSVRPDPATLSAERYYPEVRLRKMHLVRPDLIPYPISFEVYC